MSDPKFSENPWSPQSWNLTRQGAYITAYGVDVAKTKARQAGTRLGAPVVRAIVKPPLQVIVQRRDIGGSGGGGGSGGSGGSSGNGPPS